MNEIVRAVRWHRITEPFGVSNDVTYDEVLLTESSKNYYGAGNVDAVRDRTNAEGGPARISRNMPLPEITGYGKDNSGAPST